MPPPPFFFMLQAPPSSALSRSILIPARRTELPISDGNTTSFISHHGRGNFLFPFCALLCIVTYTQHRYILRIALSPYPPYNPPFPSLPQQKEAGLSPCLFLCHFELPFEPRPQGFPWVGFCIVCALSCIQKVVMQILRAFPPCEKVFRLLVSFHLHGSNARIRPPKCRLGGIEIVSQAVRVCFLQKIPFVTPPSARRSCKNRSHQHCACCMANVCCDTSASPASRIAG